MLEENENQPVVETVDGIGSLNEEYKRAESIVGNLGAELRQLEGEEPVDLDAIKEKKSALRNATTVFNKAGKALAKEKNRLQREAERKAKKEEKEAEKAQRKAEREAKAAQRKAEKEAKKAEREANRMPEQNGVRRPKPDTKCGRVWALADKLSSELGQATPVKNLLEVAEAEGLNAGNVKAEYARWRKYYGITGRVASAKDHTPDPAQ